MTENEMMVLYTAGKNKVEELQREICKLLIGKGLSYRQAELLLENTKDLLKDAKI